MPVMQLQTYMTIRGMALMRASRENRSRFIEIVLIGLIAGLCPAVGDVRGPKADGEGRAGSYYTVQLQAGPAARRSQILRTYEALKAKGYLVYCRDAYVHDHLYVRLRAGCFQDREKARVYADALREKENFDGFVAQSRCSVASFGEAFDIVTTPNDIWFRSSTDLRPLYHFDTVEAATTCSAVAIGPAGREIAFSCDNKILKIDLKTGTAVVLKEGRSEGVLFRCLLAWSPDGQHIAYLDRVGWELPTSLWVMRSDGEDDRLLVADPTGQTRVKSFRWHPEDAELFYVSGPRHGTISVGGSLYRVGLDGDKGLLVPAGKAERMEVCRRFDIAAGRIHYRRAHFDPDYQVKRYTVHTTPLPGRDR